MIKAEHFGNMMGGGGVLNYSGRDWPLVKTLAMKCEWGDFNLISYAVCSLKENPLPRRHLATKQTNKVQVAQSCLTLCDPVGYTSPWNSPGQNTGVSSLSLLQGIFPTQGSNPGLLHCRWILYQLSHKESPRILEWVAYPSPADLPDSGIEPGSPALQADSLPTEPSGKDTPIFPYCD